MVDPSGQSDGDKAISQLAIVNAALTANGFSTVGDLVTAYQKELAERKKAEEARDKFNGNNDDAQAIIRTKGGEIGELKTQVEQLEQEKEQMKTELEKLGKAPVTPVVPAATETLEEVEAAITEEQWKQADALLEHMTDDEAKKLDADPAERLKFLQGLKKVAATNAHAKVIAVYACNR